MADGHYKYRCEPAFTVVRALGGVRAVARLFNVSPEFVSKWCRPKVHGGYGGYVPIQFWEPIQLYVRKNRMMAAVPQWLLNKSKRERWSMPKAQRIKGDRFEYQVVNDLLKEGFDAHRRPLSGAHARYKGDVVLNTGRGEWLLQCKINMRRNLGGRTSVARFMREVSVGVVATYDEVFVAMRRPIFYEWLRGQVPAVVNWPRMETPGKQINDEILSHHALVFRRSGDTEWIVVMTAARFFGDERTPRLRAMMKRARKAAKAADHAPAP